MKIRTKLSLVFAVLGAAFTICLLIFMLLASSMDSLRSERQKSSVLLSDWNELMSLTNRLSIDSLVSRVEEEWTRKIENFDVSLSFFIANQINSHKLKEGMSHYSGVSGLQRAWSTVKQKLTEISIALGEPGIKLAVSGDVSLSVASYSRNNPDALKVVLLIRDFDPYHSMMKGSIQDIFNFIDGSIERTTANYNQITLGLFSIIIILSLVFAIVFAQRMASRIYRVEGALKLVSEGDFSARLNIKTHDEFGDLSRHFNSLIDDLKERLGSSLDVMRKVSAVVGEGMELSQVYRIIVDSAFEMSSATGGAILLVDDSGESLQPVAVSGFFPPPYQVSQIVLSKQWRMNDIFLTTPIGLDDPLLGRSVKESRTLIIKDTKLHPSFPCADENSPQYISSLLSMPLIVSGHVIGSLALVKNKAGAAFTDLDVSHITEFAEFSALTIDNFKKYDQLLEKQKLDQDLSIAAGIQTNLLPKALPRLPGIRVSVHSKPARSVGGDYFDCIKLANERMLMGICDVSGKGVAASMVMVIIRTILRMVVPSTQSLARLLKALNVGVNTSVESGMFATMSLVSIHPGKGELLYASAAHHPLMIYRRKKDEFEYLDASGLPLGLDRASVYEEKSSTVSEGDILVLYTDGITEAMNTAGEQFGSEEMERIIRLNQTRDVVQLKHTIIEAITKHCGKAAQHDDQTLLIARIGNS